MLARAVRAAAPVTAAVRQPMARGYKPSATRLAQRQDTLFTAFLQSTARHVVRGDTMRNEAWGPVWHATHKAPGMIPAGRHGLDEEATWGHSDRDGRVEGQGASCVVAHAPWVLGTFTDMRPSANAATRLWWAPGPLRGVVTPVIMDGKADEPARCAEWKRQSTMTLLTPPRNHRDPTAARPQMLHARHRPTNRPLRQPRGQTVAPRPGVVTDIFARDRGWRRGHRHPRWRFAAMGGAVQRHQARALKAHRSTWQITQEVLGL
jgi:hypothetical protein